MKYYVEIEHEDDGDLDVRVQVFEAGSTQADRNSIAWALRRAAELVEGGQPWDVKKLN